MRSFLKFRLPLWFVLPIVLFVCAISLGGGYLAATRLTTPCPLTADDCQRLNRLYAAWQIVTENYVDPSSATSESLVDGAITGMVDSLGDKGHSRYMSPKDAAQEKEALDGTFEGIGAYLSERDGFVIIAAPIEGSPAEKAGIRPGDRILTVDGVDMKSASISELQGKVRGPAGSTVNLVVLHEDGQTETIAIVRQSIEIPSVTWSMLPDNVAFIHLNQFSAQASDDTAAALAAARAAGATAIIFDVRNNPGGYVDQLMQVAGQFLPKNSTVLIEETRDKTQTKYTTEDEPTTADLPMVVLMNSNSASAAEILSGALKHAKRAYLIGEPTFGTATVLRPFDLDSGAQIRLGTTQWLTPDGQVVRGVGIDPDQLVILGNLSDTLTPKLASTLTAAELLASKDAQLVAAYEYLR
jgi:carboxyl-terminal processing protease